MKISKIKQPGVTLIELIVVLALFGMVSLLIYSLNLFGTTTYSKGQNKSTVQCDARLALQIITDEVRYASKVVLMPDNSTIPATVINEDCFIYSEMSGTSKVIKYKDKNGTKSLAVFDTADLTFTTYANRALCYNLTCSQNGEAFTIKSEVLPLNMQGVFITGSGSAAIQFTKTVDSVSNTNTLTFGPYPHNAYVNTDYTPVAFSASDGTSPYTFTNPSANLPPGMTLTSDGILDGRPTAQGVYLFDVQVTDADNKTNTRSFRILIGDSSLNAATVAAGIGSTYIVPDVLSSTAVLTLPTVPFGFEVYISSSSNTSLIENDGTVTHPSTNPVTVDITFMVKNLIDSTDATGYKTISITVPVGVANLAPVASEVNITGTPKINSVLTASYIYNDAENDLQGTPLIKWYRSNSPTGTKSLRDIAATYTTSASDLDKYIFCEVTPNATNGTLTGIPVTSPGIKIVTDNVPAVSNLEISLGGSVVTEASVGSLLILDYDYADPEGDPEFGTTIIWYRENNGGSANQVGTGPSYTASQNDKGKQLFVEVTPRASSGASPGNTVRSLKISITN